MKNMLLILFFIHAAVCYSQTINVTAVGSIGVSCSEYVNNMNRTWEINIPGNRILILDYSVRVEYSYDKAYVYSIDNSGAAVLQAMLTGSQTGRIQSMYSNGKMRVVFTSDGSVNCSTNSSYGGININISKISGITYSYDASGNRINRDILLSSGAALRSDVAEDGEEEIVFKEKMTYPAENENIETEIRIYPNPTEGRFVVEISGIPDEISGEIFLMNMGGKLVEKKNIQSDRRIEFDLSREIAGIYLLNIHLGENVSTWKIIKK